MNISREQLALRVCYFGSYNTGERYPRSTVLMAALSHAGVEVVECHETLFVGVEEKLAVAGSKRALAALICRALCNAARLTLKFFRLPHHDLVLVGYGGLGDVLLARLLSVFRRRPIVYDAFVSAYDVTVCDRKLRLPGTFLARLLWWYDRVMCNAADLVLLDTEAHIDYFVREFGLPREKFVPVWIGTDKEACGAALSITDQTALAPPSIPMRRSPCEIVFWGTFIPVHGLESVVTAAHHLRNDGRIRVTIIGGGQVEPRIRALAMAFPSPHLSFVPRLRYDQLVPRILAADVCLGTFGATEKAQRVVPCKVFECLYFGKPLITGDTPGARELLRHGVSAWLVPCDDAHALAAAMTRLAEDEVLRQTLADGARTVYETACSHARIGEILRDRVFTRLCRGKVGRCPQPDSRRAV